MKWLGLCLLFFLVGLLGCAQRGPVETITAYLEARVAADADALLSLSCAGWEAQARLEASSFRAANATLEGMTCREVGTEDGYTVVACDGRMLTTYNGETREWPLGAFRLLQEDGQWKMCGEAAAVQPTPDVG